MLSSVAVQTRMFESDSCGTQTDPAGSDALGKTAVQKQLINNFEEYREAFSAC